MTVDHRPGGVARVLRAWPPTARILWWVVRPACTLAALAGAVAAIGDGVWAALAAVALTVLVRPVHRPWTGAVAAVAAGLLVPACGIALAARTLVGVLGVRLAGASWSDGLATVVHARRQAVPGTPDLDDAHRRLDTLADESEGNAADVLGHTVTAAWACADVRRGTPLTASVLCLALFGRDGRRHLPYGLELARLAFWSEFLDAATRLVAACLAVGGLLGLWWLGVVDTVNPLRDDAVVRTVAAAALTFLLTWHLGRRADRSLFLITLFAVGLLVSCGWATPSALGCAAVCALLNAAARRATEAAFARRGAERPWRLTRRIGTRTGRTTWRAAEEAARAGRPEQERTLWHRIADDPAEDPALRAGAAAGLSRIALARSELQDAVRHADHALSLLDGVRAGGGLHTHVRSVAARAHEAVGAEPSTTAPPQDTGGGMLGMLANGISDAARAGDLARLREVLDQDLDDSEIDNREARRRLRDVQCRGHLELGSLQLAAGDHSRAAASLRRAVAGLSGPATAMEQAVARTLLGAATATTTPHRAATALVDGVRAMEDLRGTLVTGAHRSGLVVRHARVYEHVLDATCSLQDRGEPAGDLAAELVESLRRGSLAVVLRSGALALGATMTALQRQLVDLEQRDETDQTELDRLRGQMAGELSRLFASTYVPETVRSDSLRSAVAATHVLAYHLHEASAETVRGHAVWMPGTGPPRVHRFQINNPRLLDLIGVPGTSEQRTGLMGAPQDADEVERWRRLGEALLPSSFRSLLTALPDDAPEQVTVVPHGPLAALPWAALRLDDGRPLLASAEIRMVPNLRFLASGPPDPASGDRAVVVHLAEPAARAEERALRRLPCRPVDGRDAFRTALDGGAGGAYIAAHGRGEGLAQSIEFRGGHEMSAAAALGIRWPTWVVFASCLVGRVDFTIGEEPLGLPISCVLGGAETVIGGVIEVGYAAGGQAALVAGRLARGESPAAALRTEQLVTLAKRADAPLTAWASLVCISRRSSNRN